MTDNLLEIEDLNVTFTTPAGRVRAVDGLDLTVPRGRSVAVVGESGSGKSVSMRAVMGLLGGAGLEVGGSITFDGEQLSSMSDQQRRLIRGQRIALIGQDALAALNPSLTVGYQIAEPLMVRRKWSRKDAYDRAAELLDLVGVPSPRARLKDHPHQFSGGMRQRALIAMALSLEPDLLIADEPTTALDVTIQAQVLELLDDLRERLNMSLVIITHDMGVVAHVADRVTVMYCGQAVETGTVDEVFRSPAHPYTEALQRAIPRLEKSSDELYPIPGLPPNPVDPPAGCRFHERCHHARPQCAEAPPPVLTVAPGWSTRCPFWEENVRAEAPTAAPAPEAVVDPMVQPVEAPVLRSVDDGEGSPEAPPVLVAEDVVKTFPVRRGLLGGKRSLRAVRGVDLRVRAGETLGVVGESGCGKSTLSRILVGLDEPTSGRIEVDGVDIASSDRAKARDALREVQMIFQSPFTSLDPHWTIAKIIQEPMDVHGEPADKQERRERVRTLMEQVGLGERFADRFPGELSGGQQQRVGLARALASGSRVVICDEPVSALDVSIQAQVLNLLRGLQQSLGLAYVFIAHNLAVVAQVSDHIAVMYLGRVVEHGRTEDIFTSPRHPYTRAMLEAALEPDPDPDGTRSPMVLEGELPSPLDIPSGCSFRTRCWKARDECATEDPVLRRDDRSPSQFACLFPEDPVAQEEPVATPV